MGPIKAAASPQHEHASHHGHHGAKAVIMVRKTEELLTATFGQTGLHSFVPVHGLLCGLEATCQGVKLMA